MKNDRGFQKSHQGGENPQHGTDKKRSGRCADRPTHFTLRNENASKSDHGHPGREIKAQLRRQCGSNGRNLHQPVIRIEVFNCGRGDQFVLDKNRGWNWSLIQDVEADANQVRSIALRKKGY